MDPTTAVDAIRREIRDTSREGKPARVLVAERSYSAPAGDVWDALTNPDRIPRWLLPISGDLRLGGRYQLEGNAGGTIETCDPPRHLGVTWEYEGGISWVDVHLAESGETRRCGSSTSPSPTTSPTSGTSSGPARSASVGTSPCSVSPNTWDGADVNAGPDRRGRGRVHAPQQRRLVSGVDRLRHSSRAGQGGRRPHDRRLDRGLMHAFEILGDPVRRRILELVVDDELTSARSPPSSAASSGSPNRRSRSTCASPRVRLRPRTRRRRPPPLRARRHAASRRRRLARTVPSVLGAAPRRPRHRDRPRQADPPSDLTAGDADCGQAHPHTVSVVGEALWRARCVPSMRCGASLSIAVTAPLRCSPPSTCTTAPSPGGSPTRPAPPTSSPSSPISLPRPPPGCSCTPIPPPTDRRSSAILEPEFAAETAGAAR